MPRSSPRRPLPRAAAGSLLLALFLWAAGCEQNPSLTPYEMSVLQARFEKDGQLRDPERTILRPRERDKFQGLRYYAVDSTFRFHVPLLRSPQAETLLVAKQQGPPVAYRKLGYVELSFPGGAERLAVYQGMDEPPDRLWIPFMDPTNGEETYGGGRYLDAGVDENGMVLVDFNSAYNPFCEYNPDDFNCAIPPAENRLKTPIRAGEQRSLLLESS